MVHAVRMGSSMRSVAAAFGVSVGTVALWVARAQGQRLDRVDFADGKPGRAANRLPARTERRILRTRELLRTSVLGEYGAQAIAGALAERHPNEPVPGRATIHRVLVRHGAIDSVQRQRRAPPPKGWYLPEVAQARAELDSFDFIEDLKIANGPLVSILTATSLHGALANAWAMTEPTAQHTLERLLQRWRQDGLPGYAQFDNDTVFQGTHRFADSIGRVIRLCLALGVTPVFAPPREPGFQNAIEGFNALWQAKVWLRHRVANLDHLDHISAAYISAHRTKTASRADAAPARQPVPKTFALDLHAPLRGSVVFIRRTTDSGSVNVLGRQFAVDPHWIRRLVRCEVDFTNHRVRFYALRRREPHDHPLLAETSYIRHDRPFQGKPQVFNERCTGVQ
jgi:transposase-like protein